MDSQAPSLSRLPEDVVAALRAAFAEELAARLPRLRALAEGAPPDGDVLRDAHSLGSSAAVMGDPEASLLARDLERVLGEGGDARAAALALVTRLAGWAA